MEAYKNYVLENLDREKAMNIFGVMAYGTLAVTMMKNENSLYIWNRDVTNFLLASTVFVGGVNLYRRPHMQEFKQSKRILYAGLGSTLFGMGSVLGWALLKHAVPRDKRALSITLGLLTGGFILRISLGYLRDCDELVAVADAED